MISSAPKPSIIPYNKRLKLLKPERLKKRKAVTIGIGFLCSDGIVLCSDTQVTWERSHKYYEHKIYQHGGNGWVMACTYSGNPSVVRAFNDKFDEAASGINDSWDASKVQQLIEFVLDGMDVLNDPSALSMVCGIVIPDKEMRLVHTEGKVASIVKDLHFVGLGDSSLLRYLIPTLTQHNTEFTTWQAIHLGIYLTIQAKRYVDGCGGDTDIVTIKPNGRIRPTEPYNIEQDLLRLEFLMSRAATGLFDMTMPDDEFQDHMKRFVKEVEEERQEIKRRRPFQ